MRRAYHLTRDKWTTIKNDDDFQETLRGAIKLTSRMQESRSAKDRTATQHDLMLLTTKARTPDATHDDLLFGTIIILAFGGLHRMGELCASNTQATRAGHSNRAIKKSSVTMSSTSIEYTLPQIKTGSNETFVVFWNFFHSSIPAYEIVTRYMHAHESVQTTFFLTKHNGAFATMAEISALLQNTTPHLTPHSFRAGGASELVRKGLSTELTMQLGRWKSTAWTHYVTQNAHLGHAKHIIDTSR